MSDYKDLVDAFIKNGGEIKKGKPMKRTKGVSVQKTQRLAETKGDYEQWQNGEDNYEKYKKYLNKR